MTIARFNDMAAKNIAKGSEEWMMFQDFFKLSQEVWEPEDTDEYWEWAKDKAYEFYQKYKTPYAREFAAGLMIALESVCKERKEKNDTEKGNESSTGSDDADQEG